MSNERTIWEEGVRPGRQVAALSVLAVLVAVAVNLLLTGRATVFFDMAFIAVCVTAALSVRPRDFFVVGVLPPLLMFGTVLLLALTARAAIADAQDGLVQAVVSGLAHHAGALSSGYALTLGILALRQVARRNAGRLRSEQRRPSSHAMS